MCPVYKAQFQEMSQAKVLCQAQVEILHVYMKWLTAV